MTFIFLHLQNICVNCGDIKRCFHFEAMTVQIGKPFDQTDLCSNTGSGHRRPGTGSSRFDSYVAAFQAQQIRFRLFEPVNLPPISSCDCPTQDLLDGIFRHVSELDLLQVIQAAHEHVRAPRDLEMPSHSIAATEFRSARQRR